MIAVVHRGFASVPLLSPSSRLPSVFSPRFAFSSVHLRSRPPLSSRFSVPLAHLFSSRRVRFHEVKSGTRRYTRAGLICAQRERHELMHVAHAGRESVGSLSSRTPALTRIHHRPRNHLAGCPSFFLGRTSERASSQSFIDDGNHAPLLFLLFASINLHPRKLYLSSLQTGFTKSLQFRRDTHLYTFSF